MPLHTTQTVDSNAATCCCTMHKVLMQLLQLLLHSAKVLMQALVHKVLVKGLRVETHCHCITCSCICICDHGFCTCIRVVGYITLLHRSQWDTTHSCIGYNTLLHRLGYKVFLQGLRVNQNSACTSRFGYC